MKKLLNTFLFFTIGLLSFQSIEAQRRNTSSAPSTTRTNTRATQQTREVVDEENYNSILSFGLTTNTNSGLLGGVMARKEILIDKNSLHRQFHYFNLEIVNVNHPKENTLSLLVNGGSYVDEKVNYLFAIRPQYGREINLFHKSSDGGVNINGIIAGGPTIGIVKPYYVQVIYGRGLLRDEAYDPNKHSKSSIYGSGGFFEGIGQSDIVPGVNLKAALNFELDAFRQSNISLEIGFLAEAYTKKINILAKAENKSVFTSGYLTIFFGGKK